MNVLQTKLPGWPASEHTLILRDGCKLFYRAWKPWTHPAKALILLHRGHEHSGRWQETAEALGLEDTAILAWDARGHGRSQGERGAAENVAALVSDLDQFVRHISES